METLNLPAIRALRPAWNKGRIVGQKRPLKPKHVWAIRILTNPVYRGLIRHKDKVWPGSHTVIISDELWDRVQDKLQSASARRRGAGKLAGPKTIKGLSAPLIGNLGTRQASRSNLQPVQTRQKSNSKDVKPNTVVVEKKGHLSDTGRRRTNRPFTTNATKVSGADEPDLCMRGYRGRSKSWQARRRPSGGAAQSREAVVQICRSRSISSVFSDHTTSHHEGNSLEPNREQTALF